MKTTHVITMVLGGVLLFGAGYFIGIAYEEDMPDMNHAMDMMTTDLDGKSGDDFDKAFLKGMIVHHQGAIDMAAAAKVSAKHQEIKDLSDAIISAQTTEIGKMQTWLSTWYGETTTH